DRVAQPTEADRLAVGENFVDALLEEGAVGGREAETGERAIHARQVPVGGEDLAGDDLARLEGAVPDGDAVVEGGQGRPALLRDRSVHPHPDCVAHGSTLPDARSVATRVL